MTSRVRIFSHNPNSEGSKYLSEVTGIKRLRHTNSKFVPRRGDIVVNWGHAGNLLDDMPCIVLNDPNLLGISSNKRSFFEKMKEAKLSTPEFTSSQEEATKWLSGGEVVARKVLSGHSGEGIVIVSKPEDMVKAPLYTKYIPKKEEYRVHVFCGEVIAIQRKIKRPEAVVTDWHVRNLESGFVFARNDLKPDPKIADYALACVSALGIDFGAVDIIYNNKRQEAYLLEVNTSPGLTGTTLENYKNALLKFVKENS